MDPIYFILGILIGVVLLSILFCRDFKDQNRSKRVTRLIILRRLSERSRSFSICKSTGRSRSRSRSKTRSKSASKRSSPPFERMQSTHIEELQSERRPPCQTSEIENLIIRYNQLKPLVPTPSLASSDSQSTPRVSFLDTPRISVIDSYEYPQNFKLTVINELTDI